MRGLRQPHAGAGRPGGGPAELGDRGRLLSVAAAPMGRRPGPAQPGVAGRGVDARRCAGASPLAPAGRRLPAAAGRLGAVRRARRGGHQVQRRRPVHRGRRLAAGPDRERAQVPGSVRRRGGARLRQQRRPGPPGGRLPPAVRGRGRSQAGGSGRGRRAGGNAAIPGVLADTPRDAAAGPRDPAYRRHDQPPADVPGQRPSRRSSAWWRRGRSRRSSGTASRPR